MFRVRIPVSFALILWASRLLAADYYVATNGSDSDPGTEAQPWKTIQKACTSLAPGDTAFIKAGTYSEKVTVGVSGSATGGHITIRNHGSDRVVLDGAGVSGSNMIYILDKSYLKILGLEIRNNTGVKDGSGIRIEGSGRHIELRDNTIHDIRGSDAMGITVYGSSASASISNLIIDGNTIYDCDPARSEALTLNGNVEFFEVTNNIVRDVNNIGIDFIGGEGTCPDGAKDLARDGLCRGNIVYRARSSYGGGFGAGIYVDGGRDIVVEGNTVYECDLGIEVGAEVAGRVTEGIKVRDNLLYSNEKAGLVFGGFEFGKTGKVSGCSFLNNTCYKNDTLATGHGELWVNDWSENNVVQNNVFFGTSQNVLLSSFGPEKGFVNNTLNYNDWYVEAGAASARFSIAGTDYLGFSAYTAGAQQDGNSNFADPLFVNAAGLDFSLQAGSPSIDAGDPSFSPAAGELDRAGNARVAGSAVDQGAYESTSGSSGAPVITSALNAGGVVGEAFSYTIAANGDPTITFQTSELPAGLSLAGAVISGTPIRAGSYSVTLTATNSVGSGTRRLTLVVSANSTYDGDGDGFPDELEDDLGISSTDAADTPLGGASNTAPITLVLAQKLIKLNFAISVNKDSILLSGTLPVADGFDPQGEPVVVYLGGVTKSFSLEENGKSPAGVDDAFKIRLKRNEGLVVAASAAPFTVKCRRGTYASEFTDEELVGSETVQEASRSVFAMVIFSGAVYQATLTFSFTASASKKGVAK